METRQRNASGSLPSVLSKNSTALHLRCSMDGAPDWVVRADAVHSKEHAFVFSRGLHIYSRAVMCSVTGVERETLGGKAGTTPPTLRQHSERTWVEFV